ncbi:hypothetical protein PHJA_000774400 [Phtheirospermum japonicum]|uniref:RNI-like superfamily protein n=1 Tax=Phtheirospermum japonicum TaxID=374723 RepID=A0A830BHC1_9LAMI|nr:hypothetical protein PHJA_000774400 [Phtheirospermum japonicum]
MANSEEQQSANGGRIDDVDRADQISDGGDSVNVSAEGAAETSETASQSVTRRLTEIFVADGDVDLLLQRSDRDGGFLRWLRALDMQVMGACRADERLKPLLKLNVSAGVAEDGLLAHLSQHFEPSEVGLLARCLCVPLVSIRVGKINKQGTLLSPTSVRGNLCLSLLPTSDLRISFNGDDGSVERLATLSTKVQCTDIEIEEIHADKSGRSFLLKTSDSAVSYFWCSEKSKLSGDELLGKMKDLLMRKPSLADLTGISESRLNCFASHLRAYLTDTVLSNAQAAGILSSNLSDGSADSSEPRPSQSSFNFPKSSRSKTNLIYLGSLSPRPSSFKDGLQKSLSSLRTAAREKLRRRGENYVSDPSNSISCFQKAKLPETVSSNTPTFAALNFLDVFGKSTELPISGPEIKIPSSGTSSFSPQYCWCPIGNPPISSSEPFSLPPLSSLLSSASKPLLNVAELPPLDFPSFLPEPVVRLPTSQQFPTFTPLMCDPIVHIPVINVCSSGQGYLVTSIPPLVDPLLPNGESAVEKGARETLRMLINNQANGEQNLLGVSNSMSSVGLVLLSEKSMGKMCGGGGGGRDDLIDQKEKPSSSSGSSGFDEGMG